MIYIATHKRFNVPQLNGYQPLQVGAEGKSDLGYLKDNTGDNISVKNPNYCELTGLYWIWKNAADDYKGLVHYRRYFGKSNLSNKISDVFTYQELLDKLKNHDIVLSYQEIFLQNAKNEIMIQCCTPEIFSELRKVMENKFPDYIDSFDGFFSQNKSSLFNMMFCKKELFDEYCEWLFAVLFELEQNISLTGLNDYQKRLFGFISERLLNVWVCKNKLKSFYSPIIQTELPYTKRLQLIRRRITNNIRYNLRKA